MMKRRNLILGWKNEALMCSHNGVLLLMACLLVKKKLKSMPHSLVKYTSVSYTHLTPADERSSVSALFQGAADVTTCLSGNSIIPFSSQAGIDNLFDNIEDRWSPDDPTNEDVFYPRLHYGNSNNSNNYRASTWWLRNMDCLI